MTAIQSYTTVTVTQQILQRVFYCIYDYIEYNDTIQTTVNLLVRFID